ncbi:MAG: hypothetical protein A2236_13195 [Bacteroidetes bacterium RIFOXYA2_FULL_33_7]|nr:MAG: hypothetical protein A2236_13195 [Bacteroidetes bacterium RIFOXYA2_FULL_33_7]
MLFLILAISAILTFLITIVIEGILSKYRLPFLSIPFLLAFWAITLATSQFTALGISQRWIYALNDLYLLGGQDLVDLYLWWNEIPIFLSLKAYFISLGAIFFQYSVLAGILISLGILIYSRIAFTLSLIGFYAAYLFYNLIGAEITEITYTYIGFNYILSSIAIGGFFLIPSYKSYVWTIVLVPIVAVLTISSSIIFYTFGLSVFSLPFNIIVLSFLYVLKLRLSYGKGLNEVVVQHNSPEKNLSSHKIANVRFGKSLVYIPIKLPFWGEWTISQGHDGDYTHKKEWRHAWDFLINDEDGKQYQGDGKNIDDYYVYNKNVLATADGYINDILDDVKDNNLGEINLEQNWGNTIVIKHHEYLYSKLSHLKAGSLKIKKGEFVKQGQVIAQCGNSGRSPYPHLHFQLQVTPYIGSKTISYPISHFITKEKNKYKFHYYEIPSENEVVSNIQTNELLKNAFNFIVGKKLSFTISDGLQERDVNWEIKQDFYGNSYVECETSKSKAFFINDGVLFSFKHFEGDKKSFLYQFMLSLYNVQLGFYVNMKISDLISADLIFKNYQRLPQDFVSPFFTYLKGNYSLNYVSNDDAFSSTEIVLGSQIEKKIFNASTLFSQSTITITSKGIDKIYVESKNQKVTAKRNE